MNYPDVEILEEFIKGEEKLFRHDGTGLVDAERLRVVLNEMLYNRYKVGGKKNDENTKKADKERKRS